MMNPHIVYAIVSLMAACLVQLGIVCWSLAEQRPRSDGDGNHPKFPPY
jgi:hypothetical protein